MHSKTIWPNHKLGQTNEWRHWFESISRHKWRKGYKDGQKYLFLEQVYVTEILPHWSICYFRRLWHDFMNGLNLGAELSEWNRIIIDRLNDQSRSLLSYWSHPLSMTSKSIRWCHIEKKKALHLCTKKSCLLFPFSNFMNFLLTRTEWT